MNRYKAFFLWLAYYPINWRKLANTLQRWILERNALRATLGKFETPEALAKDIGTHFKWRSDTVGRRFKFWDWSSEAEVTQARLDNIIEVGDGDCDDIHHWAAVHLSGMLAVTEVQHLSVGYNFPKAGHTVTLYKREGQCYVLNYKNIYYLPDGFKTAYKKVIKLMRPKNPLQKPRWAVRETVNFKLVAIDKEEK